MRAQRATIKVSAFVKSALHFVKSVSTLAFVYWSYIVILFALFYAFYYDTFFLNICHCYCDYLRISTFTSHNKCSL